MCLALNLTELAQALYIFRFARVMHLQEQRVFVFCFLVQQHRLLHVPVIFGHRLLLFRLLCFQHVVPGLLCLLLTTHGYRLSWKLIDGGRLLQLLHRALKDLQCFACWQYVYLMPTACWSAFVLPELKMTWRLFRQLNHVAHNSS